MSDGYLTITPDGAEGIAPNEIEQVLQQLWRDSSGEDAEASVVQVRTLNLLIVVPQPLAKNALYRSIDTIAIMNPGRTITMAVQAGEIEPRAEVALACRFGEGGKQFCGEQITITCGDNGAPLPSIVASLLVAGVPTFLWWVGDPPLTSQRFDSIIENVDRVLLDSRTWEQPLTLLQNMDAAISRHTYIVFTDLQWGALTPWRRQTAQCFDLPNALPYLSRIETVLIRHGASDCDRVAALLFVGWLATRLDWQLDTVRGHDIQFRAGDGTVAVRLERGTSSAAIHGVELRAPDAAFTLTMPEGENCVTTNIALAHAPAINRVARMSTLDLEKIVGEELNMLQRDTGYESALKLATRIASSQ